MTTADADAQTRPDAPTAPPVPAQPAHGEPQTPTASHTTPGAETGTATTTHPESGTGTPSGTETGTGTAADPTYAAYIAGLPRILAGAAALFRDAEGRLLLVEPNYREGWVLPGGTVESDQGESPRQGARRETAEEIGLDVELGRLLTVDWVRGEHRPPIVAYLYDGGVLSSEQLAAIRLQEAELLSWRLVSPDDLPQYLTPAAARRIHTALDVLKAGTGPAELEDGQRVG